MSYPTYKDAGGEGHDIWTMDHASVIFFQVVFCLELNSLIVSTDYVFRSPCY